MVDLLRNSQLGASSYPVVPAEITNWRREQLAWRETVVLAVTAGHNRDGTPAPPTKRRYRHRAG